MNTIRIKLHIIYIITKEHNLYEIRHYLLCIIRNEYNLYKIAHYHNNITNTICVTSHILYIYIHIYIYICIITGERNLCTHNHI